MPKSHDNLHTTNLIDRQSGKTVSIVQLDTLVRETGLAIDAIPVVPAIPTSDGVYQLTITSGVATWTID